MMWIIVLSLIVAHVSAQCNPSPTTASGSHAPKQVCSGDLIFEDNFNSVDQSIWMHENYFPENKDFHWYVNDRNYTFTDNGILYIRPGLTSDVFGEEFLSSGHYKIPRNECTKTSKEACEKRGTPKHIINPTRSARINTHKSFAFKFGRAEINAKLPAGDWLWPALWLIPKAGVYGPWPRSGEIDMMESKGNRHLVQDGVNIGVEQFGSTLHFGPSKEYDPWRTAHEDMQSPKGHGWDQDFHRYGLEWTPKYLKFTLDGTVYCTIDYGTGFWDRGNLSYSGYPNPWINGTIATPFDEEFFFIMNVAVGGVTFFPDDATNPGGKPWNKKSPTAMTDFWVGRSQWIPTWNRDVNDGKDAALQVDYVRVWAL